MANIILIKTGENKPGFKILHDDELGYDSKNKNLYIGQGGFSIPIGGEKTEQNLNLSGFNINNLEDPTDALQATNKQYVDSSIQDACEQLLSLQKELEQKIEQVDQLLKTHKANFNSNGALQIKESNDETYQLSLGTKMLQEITKDGTAVNNLILGDYVLARNGGYLSLI